MPASNQKIDLLSTRDICRKAAELWAFLWWQDGDLGVAAIPQTSSGLLAGAPKLCMFQTKAAYRLADCGDDENPDNDSYRVSLSLHRA